jgi:hypothetical protein
MRGRDLGTSLVRRAEEVAIERDKSVTAPAPPMKNPLSPSKNPISNSIRVFQMNMMPPVQMLDADIGHTVDADLHGFGIEEGRGGTGQ